MKRRKPILRRTPLRRGRTRVKPISDNRARRLAEYAKVRRAYLRQHPGCSHPTCTKRARDIHHIRGRIGPLLTDTRHWAGVCREHHDWIGAHPVEARKLGLLAEVGEWGKVDR